ncbi:MAG: DUF6503 family protein [Bacteroidota bacterium]
MKSFFWTLLIAISLTACGGEQTHNASAQAEMSANTNPAAEGFDATGSDSMAIALADEVMEAMGGREAWDQTRYIHWNFLGFRTLTWDKIGKRVRIDMPETETTLITNLETLEGMAKQRGAVVSDPDTLSKLMEQARNVWINDSYWLVLPFKLKDSGVTLTYQGMGEMLDSTQAHILELTFKNVGNTPQNKYQVWIHPETKLLSQWSYYTTAEDAEPRFVMPWKDYQQYGQILLSGDRGARKLPDIQVADEMPETLFTEL